MDKVKNSVLIVDDQESTLSVLIKILSPEYTIYSADNGQDAIKMAKEHKPDVILLDILMIDMDGYAVLAALKKSTVTKDIPVIFITSLTDDDDEEKGLALGAVDYIHKPFSPVIVKLRLRNQIRILEQLNTIEKLSMIDQLTNLHNRRSLDSYLNSEWARSSRELTPISILMIDMDKFKDYNDSYGHLQGDIALQSVSRTFLSTLKRPGDFASRWGGEEFIILLPNTDLEGALEIAEQIRKAVEEMKIPCKKNLASNITISIGVNTREQGHSGNVHDFILKADNALYEAKKLGRNRVCYYKE